MVKETDLERIQGHACYDFWKRMRDDNNVPKGDDKIVETRSGNFSISELLHMDIPEGSEKLL